MVKDKLLTVRIEEDKREAFNNWCEKRNYSYSKFLYEVIDACLDGRIDESILASQKVDDNLADKLYSRLDELEQRVNSQSIDNIEEKVNSAIAQVESRFNERLQEQQNRYEALLLK